MKCPTLNELTDYTRGLLADDSSVLIKEHLAAACRNCLDNLRWLEEVSNLARQDQSFEFPEVTIKHLVAWFTSQPARTLPSLRKLIAKLSFDSLSPNQFAPVRGNPAAGHATSPGANRQMLFQTEGYDIDLRFEAIEDSSNEDLIGQILPQNEAEVIPAGVTVQLWHDEEQRMSTQTDQYGFFRFARIPLRAYELRIQVAAVEINIINLSTVRPAS
jgi:hypothetical protein